MEYAADPEMKPLLDALKSRFPITSNGVVAYRVKGPPIVPEGIAYDQVSKRLFLGDMHGRAIVEVGPEGTSKPLVTGLELQPYGMAVDSARRHLWVAVSNFITGEATPKTGLLRVHLDTKETKTFSHPEAKALNDLVVSQAGDVYTTDMGASMVWRVSAADGSWSQAVEPGSISFPNGLALDETGQRLFLSQGRRLVTKSLPDGKLEPIRKPDDFSTLGTDGLYYRDGSLYGIQNVTSPGRIVRMRLDADRTGIVGTDVLESANPLFDLPTTGAFMGDKLLVIANSQIYRIDRREPDPSELKPIVLLSYDTGSASRN